MDLGPNCRWYAVQTKSKNEVRAEVNLRRWGVETLAPTIQERTRSRRASATYRVAPLFPNYIFARFCADLLASKVRLTRGVRRVVGFGEAATPIDDQIIDLIRSRLSEDGCIRLPEARQGDTVQIVSGPLASIAGVFEREMPARDRVVILLWTMGGDIRVHVPKTAMRLLSPVA